MREIGYDEQAIQAVADTTKASLIKAVGGRESSAKRLTRHLPEYWGADADE